MNVLLFAPGLFVLLVLSQGIAKTIKLIILCGLVQVSLVKPFALVGELESDPVLLGLELSSL